jgi:hypothetical protein
VGKSPQKTEILWKIPKTWRQRRIPVRNEHPAGQAGERINMAFEGRIITGKYKKVKTPKNR